MTSFGFGNVFQSVQETAQRVADNAALASAQAAGGSMRIEPDKVDDLARFFEDEADKLDSRQTDLTVLGDVPAPGSDPVSTNAAMTFARVGAGAPNAYAENYQKLSDVFRDAAKALRESAQQVRTDDDTASLSFKS